VTTTSSAVTVHAVTLASIRSATETAHPHARFDALPTNVVHGSLDSGGRPMDQMS
jgi:hypothetical protein